MAPWYDSLKTLVFGGRLDRAVLSGLPWVQPGDRVLVAGGGTGRSLLPALADRQVGQVHYLEASGGMLRRAQQAAPAGLAVRWQVGTAADLPAEAVFDHILTPFLLDLFPPAAMATECVRLARTLRPGGYWLVTDFRQPAGSRAAGTLLWLMYRFFGLMAGIAARRLPPWEAWFAAQGYRCLFSQDSLGGLVRSQVWEKTGLEASP